MGFSCVFSKQKTEDEVVSDWGSDGGSFRSEDGGGVRSADRSGSGPGRHGGGSGFRLALGPGKPAEPAQENSAAEPPN